MKISHISVCNYRGLREVDINVDDFVCVIGENNAGKSSLLRAFALFIEGGSLKESEFYNTDNDVTIMMTFDEISDEDLNILEENPRNEIKSIIQSNNMKLVRRFPIKGTSNLFYITKAPTEKRFRLNYAKDMLRGSGLDTQDWLKNNYPELQADEIADATNQTKAQNVVDTYVSNKLSDSDLSDVEIKLPISEKDVKPLFPIPIYVEAVKDFSDEVRARQSDTFGRLLRLLLDSDPLMDEIQQSLSKLRKLLDVEESDDETIEDERLGALRKIEKLVQGNLQETFRNAYVKIRIPPPEVSIFFNNATIDINDGVPGNIDSKGDGMRRSVIFSLIRSYVELSQQAIEKQDENDAEDAPEPNYLFLFEEPELYLHPKAQKTLFDALYQISKQRHQVIVSTHSPFFFEPNHTGVFVKVIKKFPMNTTEKPYGQALSINLNDMGLRDQFQIISFETSNTAFFADIVVLVEGDSDVIAYHHIAKKLADDWDFQRSNISLVHIGGKNSIRRYREFFQRFDITVLVITDLDILVDSFKQLGANDECKQLKSTLIQKVDIEGNIETDEDEKEINKKRLVILKDHTKTEILSLKRKLLGELRNEGVFILEKGAIEAYFPTHIGISGSKLKVALEYQKNVQTRDDVIKWCEEISCEGEMKPELAVIFGFIFNHTEFQLLTQKLDDGHILQDDHDKDRKRIIAEM